MQKADGYPSAEQLREQERRHQGSMMENEAQLRDQYGTPEQREHERVRVRQEWEKIEHDKAKGLEDSDIWARHLDRMKRMALSMKDPDKCERRSRHFELAGLSTAAGLFESRAESLRGKAKQPVDAQKDLLIDNLASFNALVEKYQSRRVGEIWTREGGQRVTKRPDGVIVPYIPPKARRSRKAGDSANSINDRKESAEAKTNQGLADLLDLEVLKDGTLSSKYFGKTEKDLKRLVRELLRRLEKSPSCLVASELHADESSNKTFRKYNKAVCDCERDAVKYGKRGLEKKGGDVNSSSERCFWLATALVFGDLAELFEEMRTDARKKGSDDE